MKPGILVSKSNNSDDPEVQKWYFHMAKDGWEKFRYLDTIRDYTMIIDEFQKSYEQTPVTQRYARARILSGMKRAEKIFGRNAGRI